MMNLPWSHGYIQKTISGEKRTVSTLTESGSNDNGWLIQQRWVHTTARWRRHRSALTLKRKRTTCHGKAAFIKQTCERKHKTRCVTDSLNSCFFCRIWHACTYSLCTGISAKHALHSLRRIFFNSVTQTVHVASSTCNAQLHEVTKLEPISFHIPYFDLYNLSTQKSFVDTVWGQPNWCSTLVYIGSSKSFWGF